MFGEPVPMQQRTHRLQDLVVFSKVKDQRNEEVRKQMTNALIIHLRGHHQKAWELFDDAITKSKGVAA